MYREANGWNSLFYAPHDPEGMIALYPSYDEVEAKLDTMLVRPYCGLEVHNLTGFIGNYCHGNQPGHNIPYTYYFIGKQEKSQQLINTILDRFYDMGDEGLTMQEWTMQERCRHGMRSTRSVFIHILLPTLNT